LLPFSVYSRPVSFTNSEGQLSHWCLKRRLVYFLTSRRSSEIACLVRRPSSCNSASLIPDCAKARWISRNASKAAALFGFAISFPFSIDNWSVSPGLMSSSSQSFLGIVICPLERSTTLNEFFSAIATLRCESEIQFPVRIITSLRENVNRPALYSPFLLRYNT
jgi:hypothetical protein